MGKGSYQTAIGRALNAIENDCLSNGMFGKERPCDSCQSHIDALRALALVIRDAETWYGTKYKRQSDAALASMIVLRRLAAPAALITPTGEGRV